MKTKQRIKPTASVALDAETTNSPTQQRVFLAEQNRSLVNAINNLTKKLTAYQLEDEKRTALVSAFHARADEIGPAVDVAEPAVAPVTQTEKISIAWIATEGSECRRASITIPESWERPLIFAKGDEQLGHNTCDEARVAKDIAWVAKNPECLLFLLGDSIDAATVASPGSLRDNNRPPLLQVEAYVELHKTVWNRIIGYVGGNHERRIDKALSEGGGAIRQLATRMSSPDHRIPYSSGILLVDIHWRGHVWTFTLFHGAGASVTAGAKVQRLQRNILLSDSMIGLSGHLHDEMKTSRRFAKRTADGGVKIVKQTWLQCGTYMKWLGSYGEVAGMPPTGPDMIVIELLPDGKYIDRFKGDGDI